MRRFWGWMGTRTPWRFRVSVMLIAFALYGVGAALDHRPLFFVLSMSVIVGANALFIAREERRRAAVDERSGLGAGDRGDGHRSPR